MNKTLKIVFINIVALILIFIASEMICFLIIKNKYEDKLKIKKSMNKITGTSISDELKYNFKVISFDYNHEKLMMRRPEGLNYKKPPIILFGCSFTYGDGLKNNQTFSYKLSHLSKRPVYNRGLNGWGPQNMLYQLRRKDFYSEVKEPEYIVYTFIPDHLNRMFRYQFVQCNYILLRYKFIDNNFIEINPFCRPLWGLYTVKELQELIQNDVISSSFRTQYNIEYFYKIIKECKKLACKHYPNVKFVILSYDSSAYDDNYINKLKNDGFIVISTNELLEPGVLNKRDYKGLDNGHPSEKAWNLIVPALIKKLDL